MEMNSATKTLFERATNSMGNTLYTCSVGSMTRLEAANKSADALHCWQCKQYGQYLGKLRMSQGEAIFWGLFGLGLTFLGVQSILWSRQVERTRAFHEALDDPDPRDPEKLKGLEKSKKQSQLLCLSTSMIFVCSHVALVIIQSLAALNLAWCHQHDLINFVWGFYFIYSVGALWADFGVLMGLSNTRDPPWNVVLGTPILLFAGIAHVINDCVTNQWRQYKGDELQFPHQKRVANATHRKTRMVMAMRRPSRGPPDDAIVLMEAGEHIAFYYPRKDDVASSREMSERTRAGPSTSISRPTSSDVLVGDEAEEREES